jgi:hypothetical protein
MADVLVLPDEPRALVLWLLRQGEVGWPELLAASALAEDACRALVDPLISAGFIAVSGEAPALRYRVRLAVQRPRKTNHGIRSIDL